MNQNKSDLKELPQETQPQQPHIPEILIPQNQQEPQIQSARSESPSAAIRPLRRNNGWTKEIEDLMANWADVATCYRWLHDRTEKRYATINTSFTIPLIALTTLTGSANIAIGSVIENDKEAQKFANLAIGGVSILTGIFTTIANRFKFEARSESSRVAGMSWGKFQRLIAVELSLHPKERMDSIDFLKLCRNELDRLIEQTPPVPDTIIRQFEKKFGHIPNLKKPDICDHIEHTYVFKDKEQRLRQVAADAAIMIKNKKQLLKELVEADLHKKVDMKVEDTVRRMREDVQSQLEDRLGNEVRLHIDTAVDSRFANAVTKERLTAELSAKKAAEVAAAAAAAEAAKQNERKRSMSPGAGIALSSRVQDFLVGHNVH
jgi:hypothetical protein